MALVYQIIYTDPVKAFEFQALYRHPMNSRLTALSLKALLPGQWASDPGVRGAGRLQARCLKSGVVAFYFRYIDHNDKQNRLSLGSLTLAQARSQAASLSERYQQGERNLRAVGGVALGMGGSSHSLGALLSAYVADLKRRKKSSAREVENAIALHVHQPWPELWHTPAASITMEDILRIIRHVVDAGKLRQADKLRCHIRAAYGAAIHARQDATSLPALGALHISSNPAREIVAIRGARKAKDRALSEEELKSYWRHLSSRDSPGSALLRFHLLTGGQRIEQLARCTLADLDGEFQTLILHDPKGRRLDARKHVVPLSAEALEVLQSMQTVPALQSGQHNANVQEVNSCSIQTGSHITQIPRVQYLWTVTAGQTGACYTTASKELKSIVKQMQEAQELPGGSFTLGDIRRTVETRLAALGISREIRAQLQSHGLSGVQTRHYDRHDYLQEKKDALLALYESFKVTPTKPSYALTDAPPNTTFTTTSTATATATARSQSQNPLATAIQNSKGNGLMTLGTMALNTQNAKVQQDTKVHQRDGVQQQKTKTRPMNKDPTPKA